MGPGKPTVDGIVQGLSIVLNDKAKWLIDTFPLGFVASVTRDGRPSLSPKGTFLVVDDTTIGFAEIRSPGTLANIAVTPEVEVNFIDQWTRKGLRIRGATRLIARGTSDFQMFFPRWTAKWETLAPRINALVLVSANEIKPLTTPPYDDGVTEEDMVALYRAKYKEIYP